MPDDKSGGRRKPRRGELLSSLVDAIGGLSLGACLAITVAWAASADIGHYARGDFLLPQPDRLCPPSQEAGPGPYLDGDRLPVRGRSLLCNGFTGQWEHPTARARRLTEAAAGFGSPE
jgi:hypothetical protein